MIADAVPPAPRPLVYRSTLVAFALVLLVHVVVGWWLLRAHFGPPPIPAEEPFFVMVIADGVDDPGGASVGADGAKADPPGNAAEPRPELHQEVPASPPTPVSGEPLPVAARVGSQDDAVAIAVDKAVQNPVNNTVDKPDSPKEKLSPPRPLSPQRSAPVRTPAVAGNPPAAAVPSAREPVPAGGTADASAQGDAIAAGARHAGAVNAGGGVGAGSGPRHISRPDYLDGPPMPAYPQSARSRRQQGKVIVRVVISPVGQPTSINLLLTSGFDSLDRAALDAVRRAKFRPYAENGVALEALVDIPFDFVLRN